MDSIITTEMLLDLYEEMKSLYPETTLRDFEEIIHMDGYWDTRTRLSIAKETEHWLNSLGGRKRLKELFIEYENGTLGQSEMESKKRMKELFKSFNQTKEIV